MSELLGLALLLGLMLWVFRFMLSGGSKPKRRLKRYERPPTHWWRALVWIPIGFSLAKLVGAGAPLLVLVVTCALLAAVQRIFPRPFEIVIGSGGTLVAIAEAMQGS